MKPGKQTRRAILSGAVTGCVWLILGCTALPARGGVASTGAAASEPRTSGSEQGGPPVGEAPSKPSIDWAGPDAPAATDQGIQILNLATLVKTQSVQLKPGDAAPTADDYITALVAMSGGPNLALRVSPDPARLVTEDSQGQRFTATYSDIASQGGVTVGAVTTQGATRGGRRALTLQFDAVQTSVAGSGATATVAGSWKMGLVKQLSDRPVGGRRSGPFISRPGPNDLGSTKVNYVTPDGGALWAVTIERPPAQPTTVYVAVREPRGRVTPITKEEFDRRIQPPRPAPSQLLTPLPKPPRG